MRRAASFLVPAPGYDSRAVTYTVPSGQILDLFEVLIDEVGGENWVRFRFLAPAIGKLAESVSYAQAEADFMQLCLDVALPYIKRFELEAEVVVIALLDRPVAFGAVDPDATQYIEAFRVTRDMCDWEGLW